VSVVSSASETNLYAVEFTRHPRDLGVVVVLAAESRIKAIEQVRQLYPEYKRTALLGCVYLIQYAEIDWDNGRSFVIRRKTRLTIAQLIPRPVAEQSETQEEENE
jgi:hypothetical protein